MKTTDFNSQQYFAGLRQGYFRLICVSRNGEFRIIGDRKKKEKCLALFKAHLDSENRNYYIYDDNKKCIWKKESL